MSSSSSSWDKWSLFEDCMTSSFVCWVREANNIDANCWSWLYERTSSFVYVVIVERFGDPQKPETLTFFFYLDAEHQNERKRKLRESDLLNWLRELWLYICSNCASYLGRALSSCCEVRRRYRSQWSAPLTIGLRSIGTLERISIDTPFVGGAAQWRICWSGCSQKNLEPKGRIGLCT